MSINYSGHGKNIAETKKELEKFNNNRLNPIKEKYEPDEPVLKPHIIISSQNTNGDTFEGYFDEEKNIYYGTLTYTNGDIFEGYFDENMKPRQNGKIKYQSGEKFIGEFYQDQTPKKGTLIFTNRDRFEGELDKNGNFDYGKFIFVDGRKMDGFFNEKGELLDGNYFIPNNKDEQKTTISEYTVIKYKDGNPLNKPTGGTKRAKLKRTKWRRSTKNKRRKH